MHLMHPRRVGAARGALIATFIFALFSAGCLVTSHSEQKRSGNYVSDSTLNQIEPGRTSASWVRATLGAPSSVEEPDEQTEIWKYRYSERKDSSGSVFLLFAGNDSKETTGTVFVEVRHGVVTRYWRS